MVNMWIIAQPTEMAWQDQPKTQMWAVINLLKKWIQNNKIFSISNIIQKDKHYLCLSFFVKKTEVTYKKNQFKC